MERKISIEHSSVYVEDYQMRILQENQIEGLLPVRGHGINGKTNFDYDVSGKISMKSLCKRMKLNAKEIKIFLGQVKAVLKEAEKYLLMPGRILFRPDYIFYEKGKYYFCYYPLGGGNLWENFHGLTEYLVKQADYHDRECVELIFRLHKETMEDNYSLEKLIEECLREEQEEEMEEITEEQPVNMYDTEDHDWLMNQSSGSDILRESDNMWTPMRKFLKRHQKPKWGNWDHFDPEENLDTLH